MKPSGSFTKYPTTNSRITSTPFSREISAAACPSPFHSSLSIDTGYYTGSHLFDSDASLSALSSCDSMTRSERLIAVIGRRQSLRGKRRVDILSNLMEFEQSDYLLEKILRYLPFQDRFTLLKVCRSWSTLRSRLPQLFHPNTRQVLHPAEKENATIIPIRGRIGSRIPLCGINNCSMSNETKITIPTDPTAFTKITVHSCPVCSGLAQHRSSEWPNRLHCQSPICGVSVCFSCHREHSPSERCATPKPRPVLQLPSPDREIPLNSRMRKKLDKIALRRL